MPKCTVKMTDRLLPVKGSARADGTLGSTTGTCPKCATPGVMLSIVGGFVRAHVIADAPVPENNPQAPTLVVKPAKKVGTGLKEPLTDVTDTGARVGDPRTAEKKRALEIDGAYDRGTVKIPVKGDKGRTKLVDAPATEENVRKALAYWKARRPQTPEAHTKQAEMLADLYRRLKALHSTPAVMTAQQEDRAQVHRGPTLVRGADRGTVVRPDVPFDQVTDVRRNGQPRKRTTNDEPLGRERFDRKITDVPEPAPKRTASQRANYRKKQRRQAMAAKLGKRS